MISQQRVERAQKNVDRTREFRKQARTLRAEGYSIAAIAQQFGMSDSSVRLLLQYPS